MIPTSSTMNKKSTSHNHPMIQQSTTNLISQLSQSSPNFKLRHLFMKDSSNLMRQNMIFGLVGCHALKSQDPYLYHQIIEEKMPKMLYLGYRPATTFDLHAQFYGEGKNYPFHQFHLCKAKFLERFFKKYYSEYTFQARQPAQINPSPLIFDSQFEGGNLDAAYFEQNEYRLLIRIDSNTVGHCNFYNFKVRALQAGRVVFRIMNITKWKSLYERGLKPYIRRLSKDKNSEFLQMGEHISFTESPLNQEYQSTKLKSLKFEFEFQADCEYQFCYSIAYTYTNLLQDLKKIKQKCFHVGKLCHSLGGVEVPLVTIAAPEKEDKIQPWVVIITGRVHPSEATGSHIVNGLIKSLITQSRQSVELRQKVIFKIVPMLNPDGVILGNTRTGVAGKDLNRQYKKNADFVFPQIVAIIDYVKKVKEKYGNKLLFIIDVHGHSSRKNSFFYGPQFSIIDEQYGKCRLLPRFYATRTDIFRYHSCKYKIASTKEATARGYFNPMGVRTYTHQTSAHCFFDFQTRKDKAFTRQSLQQLGKQLLLGLYDYVKLISRAKVENLKISEEVLPKIKQKVAEKIEAEDQDSDKMSSNKDDSEDEKEDVEDRHIVQFFRKINENKEYFYEELLTSHGLQPKQKSKVPAPIKQEKKMKKNEPQRIELIKQVVQTRPKVQEAAVRRNSERKIDWINKLTYPQKKKSFQEYPKLSSVIFGSTIPQNIFHKMEQTEKKQKTQISSRPSQQFQAGFGNTTKYSINCIEAHFKATVTRYPLPEPKVFKNHSPMKKQLREKSKDLFQVQPLKQMDKKSRQRYMQLKHELLPSVQHKNASAQKKFEYQSFKLLPICSMEIPKQTFYPNIDQKQMQKRSLSLKVLPRKKSIRNIRQSEAVQAKKMTKGLKFNGLSKKLPLIGSLYFNN